MARRHAREHLRAPPSTRAERAAGTLTGMRLLSMVREVIPPRAPWQIKAAAVPAIAVGLFFVTVGLIGLPAMYLDTSGAAQVAGRIATVVPPADSADSVHLLVRISDGHGIMRALTSSEDPADFTPGQPVTLLVKAGQDAELDEGAGRYTGSLVAIVGGVFPLTAGIGLWRSHDRRARPSPPRP